MKILKKCNKANLPRLKKTLFFEGLRQLRAVGIAYAAFAAISTLLSMLSDFSPGDYQHFSNLGLLRFHLQDIPFGIFVLASAFAVLAVFYISNFMRSAKARDFYCATPHSHGTLWLNFGAAALAWTAAGVLAYFLVTAALLMPFDPKAFGALLFIACNVLAGAFMVFGMAVLAVTLTGRLVPALVTFAGLSALSVSLKFAFSEGWRALFTKFDLVTKTSDLVQYDPIYYIFRRTFFNFSYVGENYTSDAFSLFCSWRTVGYGLLMGLGMLAVAAVFGTIRTGDSVGKPFVNETAHVISLTAATLPIGAVVSYCFFRVTEEWLHDPYFSLAPMFSDDDWLVIVFAVLFVVVSFWAIELLLTFDVRHAHRAFKLFPIPVAVTMAAMLVGYFGMKAEFNNVPAADEVESFTLVRNAVLPEELAYFRMDNTFGRTVTSEAQFTDREIINYVTGKMKKLSDEYGHDTRKAYSARSIWENEDNGIISNHQDGKGNDLITLCLNLKNGGHLTRTVSFDKAHVKALEKAMLGDGDFMKKFLTLPSADTINLDIDSHSGMNGEEAVAIYNSFEEEYNSLSDAEKLAYIRNAVLNNYRVDDYGSYYEIDNEAEYGETDAVETAAVSFTDLNLISKSKKTGDFGIVETYYNESRGSRFITLSVSGYPDGSLYDGDKFFMQNLMLDNRRFPKTIALLVRTCNSRFGEIRDQIKNVQSGDDFRFCDIDASYVSGENNLNVLYRYISGKDSENALLSKPGDNIYRYSEDETVIFRDIEVDSNEMIERLFKDAASTETIDFSKPFCKFTWHNYDSHRNGLPGFMTFYAQTESPLDYLKLLDSDQPQTETK